MNQYYINFILYPLLFILILGCASKQQEDIGSIIAAISQSTEEYAGGQIDLLEMESEALAAVSTLGEEELAGVEIEFEDGKLSCELKNADLRDVISKIAELTEMEFVFSGNIYGRINARFTDKELHAGFELILNTVGYSLEEKDEVYVISRAEAPEGVGIQFHEVQPKYVLVEELIAQIATYYGLNPGLQYSALTSEGDLEDDSELLDGEPVNFLVYGTASEYDVYSTIEEDIGMKYFRGPVSLKIKEARVMKAVGGNTLYISGPSTQVDELLDLITVLDQKMPRVMIETWIVEYDDNALKEVGIDLSEGLMGKVANFTFGTTSTEIFNLPAILRGTYINRKKLSPKFMEQFLITPGEEEALAQYTINLQALMDKNKLTINSKPYIVVRSGKLARISAASEQFVVAVDPTADIGTLEQVETKTSFNIIPTVVSDNLIHINMSLEQSGFTAPAAGAVLGTNNNTANTTLTVANGKPIVIGGIKSSSQSTGERGVPILSKIPLIKYLFRASTELTESRKVNFYVTPYILPIKGGIIKEEEEEYE
jgi:type II secretory pathway component GspD/PulD (secretin)